MLNLSFAAAGGLFQRAVTGGTAAFGGVVLAASLAATPAAAADLLIDSVQFYDSQKIGVSSDPDRPLSYLTPFVVTTAGLDPLLAFCIQYSVDMPYDAADDVSLPKTISVLYQDQPDLLGADKDSIGQLVNYGTSIFKTPGPLSGDDLSLELSVIQGAIWTITTGHSFEFYPGYYDDTLTAALNAKIVAYATGGQPTGYASDIRTIVAKRPGAAQGLAFAGVAPVPEPGAWALMIGGFFVAGSLLRRGHRRSLSAA